MEGGLRLAAVVALIVANGWFVLGEFAYVAADRVQLGEAADAGEPGAQRALALHGRLSFMLSGAQLGITATSLLVGAVAEPLFRELLAPVVALAGVGRAGSFAVAATVGVVLSSAVQMVFGELAPKNMGIARPEAFSRRLSRGMGCYLRLAGPVIRLFDGSANALLRSVGTEPVDESAGGVDQRELAAMIEESEHAGALTDRQALLLDQALAFRQRRVAEVMVARPHVVAISQTASCAALAELALSSSHSRFLVVGDSLDDVVGVVRAQDVLCVPLAARAQRPVTALTAPAVVVPETMGVVGLLAQLRRSRTPLAVVVDEYGTTAGIATLEDVVEELVGSIRDEHDPEEPSVVAEGPGTFLVPGSWRPDEVEGDTGLALPTGDYETVSGLIMAHLGRVPQPGDAISLDNARLEVVDTDGYAVGSARVRRAP